MAYNISKGDRSLGDIKFEDDQDTGIDFDQDKITLETSGTVRLQVDNDGVYIADTALGASLFVSGGIQLTPGNQEGIRFANKGNNELNFISFQEGTEGGSYNARMGYNAAEYIFIAPGRGGDFFVNTAKTSGNATYPFSIMDDGTARFEKGLEDSNTRAADLASDIAFYVSGTVDGNNNALFEGNVVLSGALLAEDNVIVDGKIGIGVDDPSYKLEVGGNMAVGQYIYHRNDANTFINFTDNRVRINAGGNNFIDCEDPGSAPHKVRVNNGGNNIDFVIKDNSGDVYFTADASTTRIGIGTETPERQLHVSGAIKNTGAVYRKTRVVTSFPYTVADDDYVILVGGTGTPRRLDLPAKANHEGRIIIVKDSVGNASSNNIELNPDGSETIEGLQDKAFNSDRGSVTVLCADDGWHIIGDYSG